jgi:hypothetical protein
MSKKPKLSFKSASLQQQGEEFAKTFLAYFAMASIGGGIGKFVSNNI